MMECQTPPWFSGHGPLLEGNVLGQHDPLKTRVLQTVALVNVLLLGAEKNMLGNKMFQHWKLEICKLCVGQRFFFYLGLRKMDSKGWNVQTQTHISRECPREIILV